jgi:hypothetical protein
LVMGTGRPLASGLDEFVNCRLDTEGLGHHASRYNFIEGLVTIVSGGA